MATTVAAERVEAVRAFNRDYTRAAGLIAERMHDTPHSLAEARVLWELDESRETSMLELRGLIDLDAGYLSRVVSRLERQGLIRKRRSDEDGRVLLLSLTEEGAEHLRTLDTRSADQVERLLEPIPADRQSQLVTAMRTVNSVLSPGSRRVELRSPAPGDLGWIVERHGALYEAEYGWGAAFEALVAGVIAEYAAVATRAGNAAWIATLDGERAGSILCVDAGEGSAKLRLLLVEPFARGHGIGARLVDECVSFARRAGYRELVLWTNEPLRYARPIYERAGFELDREFRHSRFGIEMLGQDWRLAL